MTKSSSYGFGEIFLLIARFVIPILLWVAVFRLVDTYTDQSAWSLNAKIYLFWAMTFACLTFLVIVRVTEKQDMAQHVMFVV